MMFAVSSQLQGNFCLKAGINAATSHTSDLKHQLFLTDKKNVSSLQVSRVSPPSHSRIVTSQSLGPGFVWVKNWTGVPCWTMLVVSWITGNESIQKDPWNPQTYGCCDVSLGWWMKSLGNVELLFWWKNGTGRTGDMESSLFVVHRFIVFVFFFCGPAIADVILYRRGPISFYMYCMVGVLILWIFLLFVLMGERQAESKCSAKECCWCL